MSVPDRISAFTEARNHHQDTHTLNLLNTSLGNWLRYWGFLKVIRGRYVEASETFAQAMQKLHERLGKGAAVVGPGKSRQVTPEELEEMERTRTLTLRVHLEIESFYVFANILLDRIASTFRFYFWRRPKWNHRQLAQNLEKICTKKFLVVPLDDLLKMPHKLEELIVAYRNTRIEHVEEPRLIFGTSWGPDKRAKITPNVLYPAPGEVEKIQHSTADLDGLLASLDTYMTSMLDFLDANADKSILPPQQA